MKKCPAAAGLLLLLMGVPCGFGAGGPIAPGAGQSGSYPNALSEVAGIPPAAVQSRIDSTFRQLFYGDNEAERLYFPVGEDMAFIEDIPNNDVRTEGMSYGMMIAVQLDKKREFDRLWKWAKTYMYMANGPHRGYFAWHCRPDGSILDSTAASDGEEWFVTALYFASARWGEGDGIFTYRREAEHILHTMLHKEEDPDHGHVTNMFHVKERLVSFVPDSGANHFTDPSYQLPHFYELWARWAPADNAFWKEAAAASRDLLRKCSHPTTGLCPDYCSYRGIPETFSGGGHDKFRFDAWRVAMNVAVDWSWFEADAWAVSQSNRLLRFFASKGITKFGNQFSCDGTATLGNDHSPGLVAALAVAATAASDPLRTEFLHELWRTPIPRGQYRYYDGMLYLLGLLQASGNFRIYSPGREDHQSPRSDSAPLIRYVPGGQDFPLSSSGVSTPLFASPDDFPGVLRVLRLLQTDIESVSGVRPDVITDRHPDAPFAVLVGTLGKNLLLDSLVRSHRIDVAEIAGKWEASVVQTVEHPLPGVERALVVVGSDKRGTMYGMLNLSRQMGVSPWHWWADVAVRHHDGVYVTAGRHVDGPPSVRYRGIFLNDEFPALTNWVREKYGSLMPGNAVPVPADAANYGHEFYERIFELLLRLRANYLWPAMWNNAFNEDDPENPRLADEYGIVMGTSHQEPMLRAQKEWDRRYLRSLGTWNYEKYPDTLEHFWREGIRRNRKYESIITIGLRGANDTPMAPGGPETNRALLEKIIGIQRNILAREMSPDLRPVPQVWCLYKEVLDFYNSGMRVPDDVTLLWPDDNWGNIRRLPTKEERNRRGGAGVYYHFDYHGGPRSYQWINANSIAKIWDQLSLAKEYGADRIWIVNVGHLKGYEFPLTYFLDLAWDTGRWTNTNIAEYTRSWAEEQFGPEYASDIAEVIARCTRYNGRRKPELLSPDTYSLVNYREAETVVAEYEAAALKAEEISAKLPDADRNAFYELVLFPAKASATVNALYVAAGKNALYARQRRSATNDMAEETRALFVRDTSLMGHFNRTLAGGKWAHFMDQPHLGYLTWQDPPTNSLRAIPLAVLKVPEETSMGVAVEGSEESWPGSRTEAVLPSFAPFGEQRHYLEIFNRGFGKFSYSVSTTTPWIEVSTSEGEVEKQVRIWVAVDWKKVRRSSEEGELSIVGTNHTVTVDVRLSHTPQSMRESFHGFLDAEGYVAMEAAHFTGMTMSEASRWVPIEEYGHTLSAMRATSSAYTPPSQPEKNSPRLEYGMFLSQTGKADVDGIFGPTLNFVPQRNLRYAVAFDEEAPQIVTLVPRAFHAQNGNLEWEKMVKDNAHHSHSSHRIMKRGYHTLKVWMVDPGVVLEKIVVNMGGVRPSYLGPPESCIR